VEQLFREPVANIHTVQHSTPWRFTPPAVPLPEHLSVSALKSYLECPFRFFLRHLLKLQSVDTQTREMSAAAFGNLFHDTVAELAGTPLTTQTTASELIGQLHKAAESKRFDQYGNRLSFALKLQEVALHARLETFAYEQIKDLLATGNRQIIEVEKDFELSIAGLFIRGRIDRIDRLADGRLELIDYKTSDTPVPPEKAHLAPVARKAPPAHLPEAAFFEHEGKRYRWKDLQLPLYLLAERDASGERPNLAYFNLAKTAEKSGIERWQGFTESHLDAALACAEAIVGQIRQGIFWPPNPDAETDYDPFAPLFPDGIAQSVHEDDFLHYRFSDAPETDS
jgi:ATP-dependent helicase/nuclease subunit B